MKRFLAILMMICLFLSGCARQSENGAMPDTVIDTPPAASEETENNSSAAPKEVTELGVDWIVRNGIKQRPDEEMLAAQTAFALNLLRHGEKGKNQLISPLSASAALVLAANGAEGKTLEEFLAVLGVSSKEEMNMQYGKWFDTATKHMLFANSVWIRQGEAVKEDYLTTCKNNYDVEIFQGIDPQAVNAWLREETQGKINEMNCSPDAELHLINALAFDLLWQKGFEENGEDTFTDYAGKKHTLPEMKGKGEYYFELENAVGFTKRYAESPYTFAAILPEGDLDSFLEELKPETLKAALGSKSSAEVTVEMPPFQYEMEADLSETLSKMGIADAFKESADFSGISQGLYLDKVIQKCVIDMNEKGTAAGAATDADMQKYGYGGETMYRTVKLNRPFVYMVLDMQTDLPVFIGTVATF